MMRRGANSPPSASEQLSSNFNQNYTEVDVGTDKTNCQVMVDLEWSATCSKYPESVGMYMNGIIKAVDASDRSLSVQIKTTCTLAKQLTIANNTCEGIPFHLVRRQPVGGELKRLNNKNRKKRREEPVTFDLEGTDARLFYGDDPEQPRSQKQKVKHLVRMMLGSVQPNPEFYKEWRTADLERTQISFNPNTTKEKLQDYIELKCFHNKLVFEFGDPRVPGALLPWLEVHALNCHYIQRKRNTNHRLEQLNSEINRMGEGADTTNLMAQRGELMERSADAFIKLEGKINLIRNELRAFSKATAQYTKTVSPVARKPPRPNTLQRKVTLTVTPPTHARTAAPAANALQLRTPRFQNLMRMTVKQTQTVSDPVPASSLLAIPSLVDGYSSVGTADIDVEDDGQSDSGNSWEPSVASAPNATAPTFNIDNPASRERAKYYNYDFIKITKKRGRRGRQQTWVRVLPAKHGFIAPGQIPDILLSENAKVLSDHREKQGFEWDSYEIMGKEERDMNLCDQLRDLEQDAKRVNDGSMEWLHFFKKHRYALENHAFLGGDVSYYAVGKVTKFERLTVPLIDVHHFTRNEDTPEAMMNFMAHQPPFKHELTKEHMDQYWKHRQNIKDGPKDHNGWLDCPEHTKRYYKSLAQELIQSGFKGQVAPIEVLSCTVMSGKLAKHDCVNWGLVQNNGGHWCYEFVVRVRLSGENFDNVAKYQREHNGIVPYQVLEETYNCRFQEMQKPRIPEHQKYNVRAKHDWLACDRGTAKHPPRYAAMLKQCRTDLRETLRKGQPKITLPQPAFDGPSQRTPFMPPAPITTGWGLMPPQQYPVASIHSSPNHFGSPNGFWAPPAAHYLPVGNAHGIRMEGLHITGAGGMQMVQDSLAPSFTPGGLAPPSPMHNVVQVGRTSPMTVPFQNSKFAKGDIVTCIQGEQWKVTSSPIPVMNVYGVQVDSMLLCANTRTNMMHQFLESQVKKNMRNSTTETSSRQSPVKLHAGIPTDDQSRNRHGVFVPATTQTPESSPAKKAPSTSPSSETPSRPTLIRDRSACTDRSPTTSPPASARSTPKKEGFTPIRGEGTAPVSTIPVHYEANGAQKTAMQLTFGQQNSEAPSAI